MMTSFITIINQFLSWLNINQKLKNRIYVLSGYAASIWLITIILNYFKYNFFEKGIIFSLILIILLYFLILNTLFYFFNKSVKWDITKLLHPIIDKMAQEDDGIEEVTSFETNELILDNQQYKIKTNVKNINQENIKKILTELIEKEFISDNLKKKNFHGVQFKQIEIPNVRLIDDTSYYLVFMGTTGLKKDQLIIGEIEKLGEEPIVEVAKTHNLSVYSVKVTGGLSKNKNEVMQEKPYTIELYIQIN